jgi:hypothetical protein
MANILGDKMSNVNRFLTYPGENEYISKKETGYYVLDDPVFERWIKEMIPEVDTVDTDV